MSGLSAPLPPLSPGQPIAIPSEGPVGGTDAVRLHAVALYTADDLAPRPRAAQREILGPWALDSLARDVCSFSFSASFEFVSFPPALEVR